jgi:electron transport complex protein RnfB
VKRRLVALIDEARCIGCTLCIRACPVDAIVGAEQRMHTVIEPYCIGCKLCLPPCPVDCIAMVPPPPGREAWTQADASGARRRARRRRARLAAADESLGTISAEARRALVGKAVARARARRTAPRR